MASGSPTSLSAGEEFRFEVGSASECTITLTSGAAEMFGAEMVPNHAYTFSANNGIASSHAIYSWAGCTIEMGGECAHSYIASETPMASILQLHGELDSRRGAARLSLIHISEPTRPY